MIQEQKSQSKETAHHGESAGIIRECSRYKSLIFIVLEGPHRSLFRHKQMGVAWPLVVQDKFEDAIYIWDCQMGRKCSLQGMLASASQTLLDSPFALCVETAKVSKSAPCQLPPCEQDSSGSEASLKAMSLQLQLEEWCVQLFASRLSRKNSNKLM